GIPMLFQGQEMLENRDLQIGFPRGGRWRVRFNSGAAIYDASFTGGDTSDPVATADPADNLSCSGRVGIAPYSVVILSQDKGAPGAAAAARKRAPVSGRASGRRRCGSLRRRR